MGLHVFSWGWHGFRAKTEYNYKGIYFLGLLGDDPQANVSEVASDGGWEP